MNIDPAPYRDNQYVGDTAPNWEQRIDFIWYKGGNMLPIAAYTQRNPWFNTLDHERLKMSYHSAADHLPVGAEFISANYFYSFDEVNTTPTPDEYDNYRDQYDGAVINGATKATDRHDSADKAGHFDGINDYLNIPYDAANQPVNLTVSLWAKAADYTPKGPQALIGNVSAGGWGLHLYPNDQIRVVVDTADGYRNLLVNVSDTSLTDDQWHHFAMSYDGTDLVLYIDGTEVGRETADWNLDINYYYSNCVLIGAEANATCTPQSGYEYYFNGDINDVIISPKVLSSKTIARLAWGLHDETRLDNGVALHFNDYSGRSVMDQSGTGNDATINNGPTATTDQNGKPNGAMSFDGSNDYLVVPYATAGQSLQPDRWSIVMWMKSDSFSRCSPNTPYLIGNVYGGGFGIQCSGDHKLIAHSYNPQSQENGRTVGWHSAEFGSSSELADNTWYHIAATFDGRYTRIYKNGVLKATADAGGNSQPGDSRDDDGQTWNEGGVNASDTGGYCDEASEDATKSCRHRYEEYEANHYNFTNGFLLGGKAYGTDDPTGGEYMDVVIGETIVMDQALDAKTIDRHYQRTKTRPARYAIGDTGPAGGIVFHVSNDGLNGLEAALEDQTVANWGCGERNTGIDGADGTAIGTGAQNTADILAGCNEGKIAAREAEDYQLNEYTDWFLPSIDELDALRWQKDLVGGLSSTSFYWSSTGGSTGFYAKAQLFNRTDNQNYIFRNFTRLMRAVRTFDPSPTDAIGEAGPAGGIVFLLHGV